jgi:hypothetical protein
MRRGRDSNPRYTFGVYTLSRRALSTTQTPLRIFKDCKGKNITLTGNKKAAPVLNRCRHQNENSNSQKTNLYITVLTNYYNRA